MRALRLGSLVAIAIVVQALALRAFGPGADGSELPERLVTGLIALGWLCVAGLAIARAPTAAWFAIVLASTIGAVELIAVIRAWAPAADGRAWVAATLLTAAVTVGAATIAAGYAAWARSGRPAAGFLYAIAGIGIALVALGQVWVLAASIATVARAAGGPDVEPMRIATRVALGTIAVLTIVGLTRDVVPPWRRAWRRRAGSSAIVTGAADAGGASLARLYLEELVPAVMASRRAAAERERARLAADLHATVVPELRSALAAVGADSRPDPAMRERLRSTLDDVESLMAQRHSAVLEEFGLAAALEWLAERLEDRTGSTVVLEVDGTDARPPRDVERAAFRVTLLALDNAARHAAAPISVRSAIGSDAVEVLIQDAGPGIDVGAADIAAREGRRGLADMRSEAASVGARLDIAPATAAQPGGARIVFRWPDA